MEIREITSKGKKASDAEIEIGKEKLKKMRKEGEKMVKGMFEFIDAQGGWFDFSYRFWPGEPIRSVRITHGEIVDLPMVLVKHLNNVYKKVRTLPDNMDISKGSVTKFSRTRFTPMDALV